MRLIDADKLDYYVIHNPDDDDEYMRFITDQDIEDAPTIDAVEVVRCKDCKYSRFKFRPEGLSVEFYTCDNLGEGVILKSTDYCSYGGKY